MMITKEQAERAVIQERSGDNEFFTREIRIVSLEQVDMSQEKPVHDFAEMGDVEHAQQGWSCSFEWRDKQKPDGEWQEWYSGHCYVIEPVVKPYVIK